jgi:GT2 family glycosyltransferase
MKYNLFILGFGARPILESWFDQKEFPNTNIRIIDNGRQTYPEALQSLVYYTTTKNIGCAGGWNLACQIAFDKLGLEKVIISNEDNLYLEEYLEELYNQCTPTNISGTYDRAFEFSLFCIHRDTYKKIGMFDENVLLVGGEDNDYKYRCQLRGVTISCLGISADFNASATGGDTVPVIRNENMRYVLSKWNNYTLTEAFGDVNLTCNPERHVTQRLAEFYKINTFPSIVEFREFFDINRNKSLDI